ncbi:QRIC2 protein, partial [Locustella ochotensis]|nr:QRIC2 protein [Locustella ochotensis]
QPCRGSPALTPISLARAVLQETKSELQKMEEQQEMRHTMLEQMVTETANRLNEQVRSWGSTPSTRWLGTSESQQEEEEDESGGCCTFNLRAYLADLLKRCEKLQEQMDTLESRHTPLAQCSIFPSLEQDQERLHNLEAAVVQMQGECEKLSSASGSLQKDSQQKQKAIEV